MVLILLSTSVYTVPNRAQRCRRRLMALKGLCADSKATAFPFELHTCPLHEWRYVQPIADEVHVGTEYQVGGVSVARI